jgi:hypothetical protein
MQRSPKSRRAVVLPQPLRKKIDFYTLAAGAAGVGMLALAHSAEAEVVYTPAKLQMNVPNTYQIDLNNDGKVDMQFHFSTTATSGGNFAAGGISLSRANYYWASSNKVAGAQVGARFVVFPFAAGQVIGPARNFKTGAFVGGDDDFIRSDKVEWDGPWANGGKGLNNRYAGVKFMINGEAHYGWIRLSMHIANEAPPFRAAVTGYAYETIANKPIIAGATKESDADAQVSSAAHESTAAPATTLGMLAMGALELSVSRKE